MLSRVSGCALLMTIFKRRQAPAIKRAFSMFFQVQRRDAVNGQAMCRFQSSFFFFVEMFCWFSSKNLAISRNGNSKRSLPWNLKNKKFSLLITIKNSAFLRLFMPKKKVQSPAQISIGICHKVHEPREKSANNEKKVSAISASLISFTDVERKNKILFNYFIVLCEFVYYILLSPTQNHIEIIFDSQQKMMIWN